MADCDQLVSAQPELDDLELRRTLSIGDLVYVRRSLRTVLKWKELGLSLGLKDAQLNMIHEEQQGNMDYCMMQMLAIWLMNIPGASWLTLKAALNNIEEHEVANTLSAGGTLLSKSSVGVHDISDSTLGIDDLAQVLEALRDLVHWQFLGLELGVPYGRLTYLKRNNNGNIENCKRDMLKFWLMRDHNIMMGVPSWSILKAALRNIGENELADTVQTDGPAPDSRPDATSPDATSTHSYPVRMDRKPPSRFTYSSFKKEET